MVIADTGFWLALANRRDAFHDPARAALADLREPLITTWPVMTETCHMLASRLGVPAWAFPPNLNLSVAFWRGLSSLSAWTPVMR